MITFACKKIKKEELIRCSFDLNKTQYNILMFLLKKNKRYSVIEIAKKNKLDRTTVQKAIKVLLKKGLVRRFQKNLTKGGYMYLYEVSRKDEIKKEMKRIISNWYNVVLNEIGKL